MDTQTTIIRGTNDKPVSSQELVSLFSSNPNFPGYLFIGYPVIGSTEGRLTIDALLISPDKGIVVFDLIEGSDPTDYWLRQDDAANKLEARLKTHRELMERRDLLIPIQVVSFAPGVSDTEKHKKEDYPLLNTETLTEGLSNFNWPNKNDHVYKSALSAIQNIRTIRKGKKRTTTKVDSRGAKLKRLEDSIATLDSLQNEAVVETVQGVQRIRGLAGSGKTIVLALKAAYLHAQHPEWRIAITFNTRSLKGQFRKLINNFVIDKTGDEPDWDNLRIVNAWGAPGDIERDDGNIERDGIYHEFTQAHGIAYFDFRTARHKFRKGKEFSSVCELALSQMSEQKPLYDVILVDEAQDFPPTFLRLCYEMLDERKQLVYAYDELQNLSGESLPSPEEIFGKNQDGIPRVQFDTQSPSEPRRDIILEKCYRNSGPVLVTAHAIGFGIYRTASKHTSTGLVQMFDHPQLWEEIGYKIKSGELKDGSDVVLARTENTSPKFLEEHSPKDDLIRFIPFRSEEAQADWLAKAIKHNLEVDELRHDDIVVINPDPLTTKDQVGLIRRQLLDMGINNHLAGVDTNPDIFFKPEANSVTFTGIYRAKGNEAGMVYIINAQDCHSSIWNLASIRNRLFTAITRSKAWVRILGVGDGMQQLIQEYERLKDNNFELSFRYPTKDEREHLMIVHRDMTTQERKRLEDQNKALHQFIADLEAGKSHWEDLDKDLRAKLTTLLTREGITTNANT